jgi:hypothetical protein
MIKPGFGIEVLHLRQSADRLSADFGKPGRRQRAGSIREYWFYPEKHFECLVSRRSGNVLSLFFHSGNPFIEADLFRSDEDSIRRRFSKPDIEGGGFTTLGGDYVGRWLTYDSGIGFDFDVEGKLRTVSVFAPKRKPLPKAAASHQLSCQHQLAALRTR